MRARTCQWTLAAEMEQRETELLLRILRETPSPGTHLEIGTAAGGTLWRMMDAFAPHRRPRFVVVDPLQYFPRQLEVVYKNLRLHGIDPSQVEIRATTSAKAFHDARRSDEHFDFIVIDGRHGYLDVMRDFRWTTLLSAGGVVCVHDYSERFPAVRWATRRFLQRESGRYDCIEQAGSLLALRKRGVSNGFTLRDWAQATALNGGRTAARRLKRLARRCSKRNWLPTCESAYQAGYVQRVTARLRSGLVHQTLGSQAVDDGTSDFRALVELGLEPHHRVVDYGCGSLRLGRHLIRYLSPGHYWGLDITDAFFMEARTRLVDADSARCNVISPDVLVQVHEWDPHVVLVAGVLQCVPTGMLTSTMRHIASACTERTQVLVTLLEAEESFQLGRFAFRHTMDAVALAARSAGLTLTVLRPGDESRRLRGVLQPGARTQRATVLLLAKAPDAISQSSWPAERLNILRLTDSGSATARYV